MATLEPTLEVHRVYTITQRADGQWQGGRDRSAVAYVLAPDQAEVEELMEQMAAGIGGCEVRTVDQQGTVVRVQRFGEAVPNCGQASPRTGLA
ncbi:MAG: hypothetical protein JNM62_08565 [Flavobacteriales bacterium]|nr:hypothetical protein [Flavobacteriales bacterium]